MDASSKDGLLAVFGLLCVLYGLGMAFFTWRSPESPYYPIFKPRWRFGIRASRQAAYVQVPLYLSLGGILLSGAFHSAYAKIFWFLLLAFSLLSISIFFVDWATDNEP